MPDTSGLTSAVRSSARGLTGDPKDFDSLIEMCRACQFVLIGEASHGTHEFYEIRADITRRLIQEGGFQGVVVEADWPDAIRVHRYVHGLSEDSTPEQALSSFSKFPVWMWGNTVVRDFVAWLREWNANATADRRAGFYGMDLYSLYRSRAEVIRYLENVDPEAAKEARERYSCFDHFSENAESYGYTVAFGGRPSCEDEAIQQLVDLQARLPIDGPASEDDKFFAEQNARLVKNSEEYFRTMFPGRRSTWNLRDRHMADTVDALHAHLKKRVSSPKIVIWAHNSHLGDARATEMGEHGEWNVGQLVRQRHPQATFLIGFTTYAGTVMAADNWGEPGQVKQVRPGLAGSFERTFHDTRIPSFWLNLREFKLNQRLLERAIGVIYRPETERHSHYFHAHMGAQFDTVIHVDLTRAVQPVLRTRIDAGQDVVPETFPTGV